MVGKYKGVRPEDVYKRQGQYGFRYNNSRFE